VRVSGDGDRDVNCGTYGCPNEAWYALSPSSTKDLDRETDRVDVWAVVCNDTQAQDDEAELAEAAKWAEKNCAQETPGARSGISISVLVLSFVDRGGGHDCDAEHLGE
jgi:hypothetical protein